MKKEAKTKGGFAGKVLYVDLTTQKVKKEGLPDEKELKAWLGCWGLSLRMLYDMAPAGVRGKDPDNPLIFWNGPLTAADVPGATNLSVATVNFNTDFTAGRSHTHGEMGINLKRAGYDALVVTGRSEKPVYLIIDTATEKIDRPLLKQLSTREKEIAELAAQGYSPLNISAMLSISVGTVRVHLKSIYRKLSVSSRVELALKMNL